MLNMIQTKSQWLLVSCLIALMLTASACQSNTDSQQQPGTVNLNSSPLGVAVATAVPGFTEQVARISGDFDENGLTDEAVILSSGSEWRLAVLFQQSGSRYEVTRLSTFPGSDDDWYSIPTNQLQLFLAKGDEPPIDMIGFKAMEQPYSLEFFWHDKTRNFIASRVHNETATQQPHMATSQNRGETILQAVDPNNNNQQVGQLDLDQQTDSNSGKADLRFTAEGGSMIFYTLDPIGQAIAAPFGKSSPNFEDCLGKLASMSAENMPEVEQGMYFCFKTDRDRLASVWVQSLDAGTNRLSLGYELWPE